MNYIIYISIFLFIISLCYLIIYRCREVENFNTNSQIKSIQKYELESEYLTDDSVCRLDSSKDLIIHSKKKVLIVSCYGYGNIGDNMYAAVFTKYLPECEIMKISDDSVFVDIKKQITKEPPKEDYNFDYLIIGGGGLLSAKKLKDSKNMPYYINIAKKKNKPLFIISCGVQGSMINFNYEFRLWKDALNYAKLVTVRSKKDRDLLNGIVSGNKVQYFRDLGYIFPHTIRPYKNFTKTITLIIAGPVHDKNETIKKAIKEKKKDVIIMNMGSLKDDNNNKRMIKMNFPGANVVKYYGCGKAPEFTIYESVIVNQAEMEEILKVNPELEKVNPSDLTLIKVINLIYNSEIVYTGRYHGFVFSRSLGIPYDTLGMDTNKIIWEEPETTIKDMVLNSYNHIKLLRNEMNLSDNSIIDIMNLENSIKSL
jgi:polysaccharide pyruvyl transferase WcaK-like protein